jgi:dihydroneopterin aldolase/D-erythro-7,8-dihydroneopterin triphosphate epimerase
MPDKIIISDLMIRCVIGVHDWERKDKQDVLFNIELEADLHPAGASDDFEDAVDYRAITKTVIELVQSSSFYLVEALAERIAEICLEDPRVQRAKVRVEKPGALRFARSVGVEVDRRQES